MKLKIVDKSKFYRRFFILIFISTFIVFLFSKASFSNNTNSCVEYDNFYITGGDTLWNIADEQQKNNPYFENKDIREIIYQIKKINNLKDCNLQIGQELKIPIL